MGMLVEGVWRDQWYDTKSTNGRFVRKESFFRNWVTRDGFAGPTGQDGFAAEAGRYHLYVSLACPWAHRTLIFRKLKGLEEAIGVSIVHHYMGKNGWTFLAEDGATGDRLFGYKTLSQVYVRTCPRFTGRVTVPVLYDAKRDTIVSNESAEIIRMLNTAFVGVAGNDTDFYPARLRSRIDEINALVYDNVNNGVYRAGFATTQDAYEEAFRALFDTLDTLEALLARQRYLVGDSLTEADWRLFTTLIRFDPVYVGHFKCNQRRIADYPNLWNYMLDLYQIPGVARTVDFGHIKRHYYGSHATINPTGVVPAGPLMNLTARHDRDRFAKAA